MNIPQPLRQHRTVLLLASSLVVLGAGAATAAAAIAQTGPFSSPSVADNAGIAENVSAADAGVTLTVQTATFSGTETTLNVQWNAPGYPGASDLSVPPAALPAGRQLTPQPSTVRTGNNTFTIAVAPVSAPGPFTLTLSEVDVNTSGATHQIKGAWTLHLGGPSASNFASLMRTETLSAAPLTATSDNIDVTATRSTSATIIRFMPAAGWEPLSQVTIVQADGKRLGPLSQQQADDGQLVAVFPPTPFGAPVTVDLGQFAQADPSGASFETIALAQSMSRAGVDFGQEDTYFTPAASDVLSGSAGLVEEARFWKIERNADILKTLQFRLAGDFQPDGASLDSAVRVTDANGDELHVAALSVSFGKNATGAVHNGYTDVDVLLPGDATALSHVTIQTGTAAKVIPGKLQVTLKP